MTKEKAISVLCECAEKYKKNLSGKNLLLLCLNKEKKIFVMELTFDAGNYLHLTGCAVGDKMSAKEFYRKCLGHRLRICDFEFAADGTTEMKLEVLPLMVTKNLSAHMIGDYNAGYPKLYTEKMVGGVKGCMGFVKNKYGRLVPNTVLKADIRQYVSHPARIIVIFRKKREEQKYSETVYRAKNVGWGDVSFASLASSLFSPDILKDLLSGGSCGKLIR